MISFNDLLEEEKQKDYYNELISFIDKEYNTKTIFPPREKIFEAFKLTPFEQTKVVIIGQDPYHGEGEAHGLAFSVNNGIKIPPSLKNIYKEINTEYGYEIKAKGWEIFTDRVIEELNNSEHPLVFMLWGNYAKSKAQLINNPKHLILESAHPSPFSARNGFFGNNHFKLANDFLEKNGIEQIDWKIENFTEQTNEDAQLSIF